MWDVFLGGRSAARDRRIAPFPVCFGAVGSQPERQRPCGPKASTLLQGEQGISPPVAHPSLSCNWGWSPDKSRDPPGPQDVWRVFGRGVAPVPAPLHGDVPRHCLRGRKRNLDGKHHWGARPVTAWGTLIPPQWCYILVSCSATPASFADYGYRKTTSGKLGIISTPFWCNLQAACSYLLRTLRLRAARTGAFAMSSWHCSNVSFAGSWSLGILTFLVPSVI